ncbi:Protein of unknown function (DUF604 [Striga hermonthica]|uniref:Uncharacterized protein n=1 Tax=Striga hermonthica TaxID=68872 RepID=A0A9N7RNS6_STRHE|nr:Protein of unknown function (DUF604 [Striga hermonthica]
MVKKITEKIIWGFPRYPSPPPPTKSAAPRFMVWLILFVSVIYVYYAVKLLSSSHCEVDIFGTRRLPLDNPSNQTVPSSHNNPENTLHLPDLRQKSLGNNRTGLQHIVFGIAASSKLWDKRKEYIKLWFKPENRMRGAVWLDRPVKIQENETESLPELRISGGTSRFAYENRRGHRSAIRISRILSETLRLSGNRDYSNVRWFVLGDDDTVFVTDNLVRVLNKYDHNQYYYIGSLSESHLQNIHFSYSMAYGGGGFAISYPLARALEKMQDRCIERYPKLYGSDERIQACMAELGVPLTKELGFHQYDVHGNLFGLLAAHPITPFVSLHHLDIVEPIFPNVTRIKALERLQIPMQLDSAGLMQQSICYHRTNTWTVSISWGFAVQIFRGVLSPREIEMPSRTFLNWYKRADYTAYAFNTRPVMRNPCQKPFVFYLSGAKMEFRKNTTVTEYSQHRVANPECKWKMADPTDIRRVVVYKKPDPHLWERSPRRNCCRVSSSKKNSLVFDVGVCSEGEISEV